MNNNNNSINHEGQELYLKLDTLNTVHHKHAVLDPSSLHEQH